MAGSVNKVIIVGNLGRDPETRNMQDGKPVVNLNIATSESWKDKQSGERREKTEWHRVVIFNENLARVAQQYLKKGSTVYIEGQLQTRKWTDQTGQEKYTTEIVLQNYRGDLTMLGSPQGRDNNQNNNQGGGQSHGSDHGQQGGGGDYGGGQGDPARGDYGGRGNAPDPNDDLDDEIPF